MSRRLSIALFVALSIFSVTACQSTGPRYQNVRSYSEGLAPVQSSNGRWGFVNEKQYWITPPKCEDAREFQGGKAAVRKNGKWGFINKRGEWL